MADKKQKNRRYTGAKISEYKLKKLVLGFAENKTVKETTETTKISEPTVRDIFMRIREHLHLYGFIRVNRRDVSGNMPARIIFAKKHRGVPEKYAVLFETEFLHRAFFTKNTKAFKKFSASKEEDLKTVQKYFNYNKLNDKYDIIEVLVDLKEDGKGRQTRAFDPMDFKKTSDIVINERNISPSDAFFNYIWELLLKHPL